MSKFSDKAEQFYMEQFNEMFAQEEKKAKEHKKIEGKYSTKDEVDIFTNVLKPITESAFTSSKKKKKKKMINEEDDFDFGMEEDDEVENVDPDDEPIEDEDEEMNPEDMDEMDEADEILQDIDLENISNATKIELIRTIIDAAQNLQMEDEEMIFDDFIVELQAVIEDFQYEEEGEGEEGEEVGEEDIDIDFEDEDEGGDETEEGEEDDEIDFEEEEE